MEGVGRKLSPAVFVLAFVCFFLPFVAYSCGGQKLVSLNGFQLAAGTTLRQPEPFGPSETQKVDPEPLATIALLLVIAGAALSFIKRKKGIVGSGSLALLGVILLAALKSKLDGEALQQGGGLIQINYEAGYYFSLILLLVAIGVSVYALLAGKGIRLPALQGSGESSFCTQCGAKNLSADAFCKECGERLI